MKIAVLFLLLLLQIDPPSSQAAYYQWVDTGGVTHFTDDADKIPAKYRKRAKKLQLSEEPPGISAPAPQTPVRAETPRGPATADNSRRSEREWGARFAALRVPLKKLQEGMPAKQTQLVELRRRRTLYMRAQDREAVNRLQEEISTDEAHIAELQNQLAELEQQADKAAIPVEWRQ